VAYFMRTSGFAHVSVKGAMRCFRMLFYGADSWEFVAPSHGNKKRSSVSGVLANLGGEQMRISLRGWSHLMEDHPYYRDKFAARLSAGATDAVPQEHMHLLGALVQLATLPLTLLSRPEDDGDSESENNTQTSSAGGGSTATQSEEEPTADARCDLPLILTLELFHLCYLNPHTRLHYYHVLPELMHTLALTHPACVTLLTSLIAKYFRYVGAASIDLFRELDLRCWRPTHGDFRVVEAVLSVPACGSSLVGHARRWGMQLLRGLNYGFASGMDREGNAKPFLGWGVHRKLLVMLAQIRLREHPGLPFLTVIPDYPLVRQATEKKRKEAKNEGERVKKNKKGGSASAAGDGEGGGVEGVGRFMAGEHYGYYMDLLKQLPLPNYSSLKEASRSLSTRLSLVTDDIDTVAAADTSSTLGQYYFSYFYGSVASQLLMAAVQGVAAVQVCNEVCACVWRCVLYFILFPLALSHKSSAWECTL
jgi:hypothetical protein